MKKSLQVFTFVLALSTAFLLAQSSMGNQASPGAAAQAGSTNSSASQNPNPSSNPDMTNPPAATQPKVDDSTLERQVHEQLATNPDLQSVQVAANNGDVSLTGSVPNKNDKKEAKKLAKSVPGVKKVKDDLQIASTANPASSPSVGAPAGSSSTTGTNPPSGTMDEKPPTATNPNAAPSTPPQSNFMRTSFMGEQATSQSGSATSSDSSSQAPSSQSSSPSASPSSSSSDQSGQSSSTGSSSAVGSPAGQSGSTTGATESSDQVKNDIQTAFRNEPTLTSSGVSVDVSSDTVTLSGSVPSQKDRDEAKRIAQSFAGSRKVVDNVKVSGMGSGSSPDMSSSPSNPNSNPSSDTGAQQNPTNPEQPSTPKKN